MKKLYKEVYADNNELLTPEQQENYNGKCTNLIEAT